MADIENEKTNKGLSVLIIDDEMAIRLILQGLLEENGYAVDTAGSGAEARQKLNESHFDVAFCDVRLGDCIGIDLINELKADGCDTEFVVMTAFASVSTAIEAMRAGAFDYLMKPMRNEDVLHRLDKLSQVIRLKKENVHLKGMLSEQSSHLYRPRSQVMLDLIKLVEKIARSDRDVLITGESGTGKGVMAREVHRLSKREGGPFIPVNCASIPENLLESELFGHVKGAFTGADRNKAGLFTEANHGIIFLDEIGEMPLAMQAKLLHVIEEKKVRPVGSNSQIPVNVRIIAATNQNLEQMIAEGQFREDLYFRLQVLQIELPPLRERHGDIEALIEFFVQKERKKAGIAEEIQIDEDARECLLSYPYPGNLREMENTIARAVALAEDHRISVLDLPPALTQGVDNRQEKAPTLRDRVRAYERKLIEEALQAAGGDRRLAAKRLGIGLSSLYRKLEEE